MKTFDAGAYAGQVARKRGWVVNSDGPFTALVLTGLAAQAERWGRPVCPCRDSDGSASDVVCPCPQAQADIGEFGQCYCGLFLAVAMDPAKVASIPERG